MTRRPIVFGTTRTLDDVPPARSHRDLWSWVAVLVVTLFLATCSPANGETLTRDEVAEIASHYWPAREILRVIRVAQCESGLDTNAVSAGWDRVFGRYAYVSLLQISEDLWQWDANRLFGYPADLRDPVVNIAVGAFIWSVQGWAAWPYCGYR